MYPRIIIRTPPPKGRTLLWLDVSPIIIGSNPNCDVVVAFDGIADKHLQVEVLENNRVKIKRLEGKITLKGKSVVNGILKEGILLQLAPTVFLEFHNAYTRINPPAAYTIKFVTEPLLNKKFEINCNKIIGRTRSDIIIKDKTVSRQHAIIEFEKGHIFIKDNNSANGIVINGQKVKKSGKQELFDHDLVDIGDVAFIVLGKKIDIPESEYAKAKQVSPVNIDLTKKEIEKADNAPKNINIAEDPRPKITQTSIKETPQKFEPLIKKTFGPDDTLFADDLIMSPDDFSDEYLEELVQEAVKLKSETNKHEISENNGDDKEDKAPVSISERLKQKRKEQLKHIKTDSENLNIDTQVNLDVSEQLNKSASNSNDKISKPDEAKRQPAKEPEDDTYDLEINKLIDDLTEQD